MAARARPVRHSRRSSRRRTLAVGAVLSATLLLSLDQIAAPRAAGRALGEGIDGSPAAASTAEASWARDASGAIVPVTPTHYDTPVHPEQLTHPDADAMGDGGLAHLEPAAATRPLAGDAPPGVQPRAGVPGQGVQPNPITPYSAIPQLPGIDVSGHQGAINWANVAPHVDFVYAKATEATDYRNPDFANQYNGPYSHGVIRGAYHFAVPNNSSGTAQADYFVAHGGGWSADGLTLPGALDIEYNPYGAECYGLTPAQMTAWIKNFISEYAAKEHAYPVIYSTVSWWKTCTGNTSSFASLDPFWIANYATTAGTLPNGWGFYTFWQHADSGAQPGDQDVFNGALSQLKTLAKKG